MRKKIIAVLLSAVLLMGVCSAASAAEYRTVSLQIEGISENIFYNGSFGFYGSTVEDALLSVSGHDVAADGTVTSVDGIYGTWKVRLNGKNVSCGLDEKYVSNGDEIVLFFYSVGMAFPKINTDRITADSTVKFVGEDGTPIAGASVCWDGMEYETDSNGIIIADSVGMNEPHTVSISKMNSNGEPAVLRFRPGYTVTVTFYDIPAEGEMTDYIYDSANRGLFAGTGGGKFSPYDPMTRAMFVTVMGRLAKATVDHTAGTKFTDVKYDGWSTGYIAWAAKNGVVAGYTDTTFGPNDSVTIEQAAAIIHRYIVACGFEFKDTGADASDYSGYSKLTWSKEDVEWAVSTGVMVPENGRLDQQTPATRAQVAAMMSRTAQFISDYYDSLD